MTHRPGFTLVETMIAIALMAILALAATSLLTGILNAERQSRIISEVEAQGSYAMYQFAQSARNTTSIVTPAVGASATSTRLVSGVAGENPTYFDVSGGVLVQKRGAAATTTLTSNTVTVSSLSFQNITAGTTKGAIRMALTLSYTNPTGDARLAYSQTFYTTVTLR
jgi:prepilin-type N-terminal cleavage/methylation domain-containing protein